uniref:Uncharacterized protein n=1 Tax=Salix viminalis TaxID=40686 RepID=A0A6N2LVD7_SALVM
MNACIRLIVVGDLLMANSSEVFKSSQVLNLSQHMMRALSSFPLPEESSAAKMDPLLHIMANTSHKSFSAPQIWNMCNALSRKS